MHLSQEFAEKYGQTSAMYKFVHKIINMYLMYVILIFYDLFWTSIEISWA